MSYVNPFVSEPYETHLEPCRSISGDASTNRTASKEHIKIIFSMN